MRNDLLSTLHCLLLTAYCLLIIGCATPGSRMVVAIPIADLRAQPHTDPQPGHDPLEETQLLYGEKVRVIKRDAEWAQVEALEQPEYSHHKRWQGYPGWIMQTALVPWRSAQEPNIVVTDKWATTWSDVNALTPSPWRFPIGTRLKAIEARGHLWQVELLDGSTVWMPQHAARPLAELHTLSVPDLRRLIIRNAQEFLGDRYYWGG